MNKRDYEILEAYAKEIYGCSFDDLSDKEQNMLICENCPHYSKYCVLCHRRKNAINALKGDEV